MKVLFISYNGALEPLMQSQGIPYLKGLSRKGVECVLFTFEKAYKIKNNFTEIESLKRELGKYGIGWYYFKYHKYPSLPATLYDISVGIIIGLRIAISRNIDIIHARATVPAVIGYIVAKLTKAKFIFDVRGLMAEEYVDGGIWKRESFLVALTGFIEKKLICQADAAIVLTDNIKSFLLNSKYLPNNFYKNKLDIYVIPCCVDLNKFTSSEMIDEKFKEQCGFSGKFIFIYIGSLGTWYLLDEMIDFYLMAKTLITNAHFLILTYSGKEIAEKTIEKRKLARDEISVKAVEFDMMPKYIKLADVGIFFIKPVFSKRSSCPTKFAEYLACGLPVIINSGVGDTDLVVEKYKLGLVVNEFTRQSYLLNTSKLIELMKEKYFLKTRCRDTAERIFSLDMGVSLYFDVYNRLSN